MQTIYVPKGKALEYGELALNIYSGCPHGCTYCYVPAVLRKDREAFNTCVEPRENIVEETIKRLSKGDIKNKEIFLCFTCDPFPNGYDHTPTYEIVEAIKDSGNNVAILTKGDFNAWTLFDLLGKNDRFGVTISGCDIDKEPRAANEYTRLSHLQHANDSGIPTFISCEPVYDPRTIYYLIEEKDYIDEYRIGKLNYAPSDINWGEFGRECERLCILHERKYMIKDGLRKEMEK